MTMLTYYDAYEAMYLFLQSIYEHTADDDLGGLLGGMSTLADGSTANPYMQTDWLVAIHEMFAGQSKPKLELISANEAFVTMIIFLRNNLALGGYRSLGEILGRFSPNKDGMPLKPEIATEWKRSIDRAISKTESIHLHLHK